MGTISRDSIENFSEECPNIKPMLMLENGPFYIEKKDVLKKESFS